MYRFYSFFVCLLVLAACSPKLYKGEHAAKTSIQGNTVDSANVTSKQESVVSGTVESTIDSSSWSNQVVVTEKYSAPDSTGRQYLMERTTNSSSRRAESSAKVSQAKEEKQLEQIDSATFHSEAVAELKQEETTIKHEIKRGLPWYVVPVALVVCAFWVVLGVKKGKLFGLRFR